MDVRPALHKIRHINFSKFECEHYAQDEVAVTIIKTTLEVFRVASWRATNWWVWKLDGAVRSSTIPLTVLPVISVGSLRKERRSAARRLVHKHHRVTLPVLPRSLPAPPGRSHQSERPWEMVWKAKGRIAELIEISCLAGNAVPHCMGHDAGTRSAGSRRRCSCPRPAAERCGECPACPKNSTGVAALQEDELARSPQSG